MADAKPHRPWREIAKQVSEEYDHNRATELVQELIRALDRESMKQMEAVKSKEKGAA